MDRRDLCYVDYDALLQCQCEVPTECVISDGLSLSVPLGSLYLYGPWLPATPDDGTLLPAMRGSEYSQRFALKNKTLRCIVRGLSHVDGVIAADFEVLPNLCEPDLLAFLHAVCEQPLAGGERVKAQPWIRPLLAELGSQSSACATVHPDALPALHTALRPAPRARDARHRPAGTGALARSRKAGGSCPAQHASRVGRADEGRTVDLHSPGP